MIWNGVRVGRDKQDKKGVRNTMRRTWLDHPSLETAISS